MVRCSARRERKSPLGAAGGKQKVSKTEKIPLHMVV